MLRVTVQLGHRVIGTLDIRRTRVSKGIADYSLKLVDDCGDERYAALSDYPRWATSVWDLVARAIAKSLRCQERLPPRPHKVNVPFYRDGKLSYVRLSEIPEPARTGFKRSIANSTVPVVQADPEPHGCAYTDDWKAFLNGFR